MGREKSLLRRRTQGGRRDDRRQVRGLLAKRWGPNGRPALGVAGHGRCSSGLCAVPGLFWPHLPPRRSYARKLRGLANKAPGKERSRVEEAAGIYQTAASVCRRVEEFLGYFQVPEAHRNKGRTTNVIEHAFCEVRRLTSLMSSFTSPARCQRVVHGVISHLNRCWERTPSCEST